jgi:hypothetical protein
MAYGRVMTSMRPIRIHQHLGTVADRRALARERGWRYTDMVPGLALRWQRLYGRTAVRSMATFGVLTGDEYFMPFTAFDSVARASAYSPVIFDGPEGASRLPRAPGRPKGPRVRFTFWVAHLPVAYPSTVVTLNPEYLRAKADAAAKFVAGYDPRRPETLRVRGDAFRPVTGADLVARSHNPEFGDALLTPEVRTATIEDKARLVGWRIEGCDLIVRARVSSPLSAAEVAAGVGQVTALARLLPNLAAVYGSEPTTDMPRIGRQTDAHPEDELGMPSGRRARRELARSDEIASKLDTLLDHVKTDGGARQQFVDLLEELGPDDPRTASYRRQLTSRLY